MNTSNNKRKNNKSNGHKCSKYSWNQNMNYDVQAEEYIELNEEESNSIKVVGMEYSKDNNQTQNYGKLGENKKYQDCTVKKARNESLELSPANE
jgi:hypothetical protein